MTKIDPSKLLEYTKVLERLADTDMPGGKWIEINGAAMYCFSQMNGAGGIIPVTDNKSLIFLKGSDDFLDFLLDSLIFKKSYKANGNTVGRVHAGFLMSWEILETSALKALKTIDLPKEREYTLVGHSLGAALAVFFAEEMRQLGYKVKEVITFGCPRLGNSSFAKHINECLSVIRIVNNFDIIPTIPFTGLGYRHIGEDFFLRRGKIINSGLYRYIAPGYIDSGFDDHRIGAYSEVLQEIINNLSENS